MRKNKGYQLDIKKSWRGKESKLSWAGGSNKTPEQILEDVNKKFDERVKTCKKEYERISNKTTLEGKELRKYCRDWMLHEVQFDDNCNLIPLEQALETLENKRKRCLDGKLYGYSPYQKRIIHKDNQKFVYNSGAGSSAWPWVRIPSLKRSKQVWKRFYELFPRYEEMSHNAEQRRIYKLKKL